NQGQTFEQVRAKMFDSNEYFFNHGGTIEGYLEGLYLDVFGRALDDNGRLLYGSQLAAGATHESVALQLLTTPDGYGQTANRMYQKSLRRLADSGSIGYWAGILASGVRDEAVLAMILASPEYYNKYSV